MYAAPRMADLSGLPLGHSMMKMKLRPSVTRSRRNTARAVLRTLRSLKGKNQLPWSGLHLLAGDVTMKIYFLGDSLKNWIVRIMFFWNMPFALTAFLTWYGNGFTYEFFVRIKFLCAAFLLSLAFLLVGYIKGRRLSNRQARRLYK